MTELRRIWILLLIGLMGASPARIYAQSSEDVPGIAIDQLLQQIQIGLAKVQKDLTQDDIPPLQSVTLNLVAEAKKEAGGKINLYIVSFGKKWERDKTQEIEITLKPPSPNKPAPVAQGPTVADELINAIENAARGVHAARQNKQVPLTPTGLKVVLGFTVKTDTSGGVKFTISPVTADLSGDLAKSAIQKVTVVYQVSEPKK
jgi:hypothetical protein